MPRPEEEHIGQGLDELDRLLATDRWMSDMGLVTDSVQHNLVLFGYLSSVLVGDVEVDLDVNKREIKYFIYMRRRDLKKYLRFTRAWEKYKNPKTIWQKWRKLRLFRKSIYMNVENNLRRMVRDYLPKYAVEIEVLQYGKQRKFDPATRVSGKGEELARKDG